jgi:uncharacterized protein (DUF302 family)
MYFSIMLSGYLARSVTWALASGALLVGCAANRQGAECPKSAAALAGQRDADGKGDAPRAPLAYTKTLDGVTDIDQAVDKVKSALASQGFGVVSDMDFQAAMKEKLDVEMAPYRILGACNPKLAHRAITVEKTVGLLLPCKVAVYQSDSGPFTVSFARPESVFSLIDDPELASIAEAVDGLMRSAFESL